MIIKGFISSPFLPRIWQLWSRFHIPMSMGRLRLRVGNNFWNCRDLNKKLLKTDQIKATESVQKRALRIVLPNCHYDDALIQSGITALSQRREEACINFIKRDCLSSPVLKPLIPCVSIVRPYCLRSGERVPVRLVPKTKRFADFCTIKFQDQL